VLRFAVAGGKLPKSFTKEFESDILLVTCTNKEMALDIIKRTGRVEPFNPEKITEAIRKACLGTGEEHEEEVISKLTQKVVEAVRCDDTVTVESIQDAVEEVLMGSGLFRTAKAFILFRKAREKEREERNAISSLAEDESLDGVLLQIRKDYPEDRYSLSLLGGKCQVALKDGMGSNERRGAIVKAAVELTGPEAPGWEFIAARIQIHFFHEKVDEEMARRNIGSFYAKLRFLSDEGLLGSYIIEGYTADEIAEAFSFIDESRDNLFTYSGFELLMKRYLIKSRSGVIYETPQEMYLTIALHLAMNEQSGRLGWVRNFYDMLSRLEVTMATPTLANARKPYHQLSSCFIDTVPDSLSGIYRSIDSFARVSKFGGGMGMYFGKVRASGSSIRGFEGAAGGIIRWIKLVNDTAVAVDQLGVRAGAVAVYLDVWHRDLPEFLSLRTNNGDDRMKAHDVFPAVCYPDYFWHLAETDLNAKWYMMCPHEIQSIKGWHLEDCYGDEWRTKYLDCVNDPRIAKRVMSVKDIIRLILKSAVETGTPFTFNRDTVNRMNPNRHRGMIYCSNLCTEIAQNMSETVEESVELKTVEGEDVVVTTTKPGDFVVCNLASISLGAIRIEDKAHLRDLVRFAIRALDNVIDLNFYPLEYARYTNRRYRAVGLGVSGYHHMLAKNGIKWESDEHLELADKLFEEINHAAIEASAAIAEEKGAYLFFEGSDWDTGEYFRLRGYDSPRWESLRARVKKSGMRNSALLAIAPTSSTSIISGTTAGIDPVMKRFFYEEKKGAMLPRLAPELGVNTWWYYRNAHEMTSCGRSGLPE
jgi:ribonucleoside-diphosphate reductase, alpha subunit